MGAIARLIVWEADMVSSTGESETDPDGLEVPGLKQSVLNSILAWNSRQVCPQSLGLCAAEYLDTVGNVV